MYAGQLVFSQVMTYLPLKAFSRMVAARRAQHKVQDFTCLDQFLVLAFTQLTTRESLRDIEINLRAQKRHFYHMGLRCKTISRNTLANANRVRPWEVFVDLAHHLIGTARTLYANEPTNAEFKSLMGATVYALDSTTIDLCLSLFSWAPFRTAKAAIKLHTLIELKGSNPSFIHISDGKMHDVKVLDILCKQGYIEAGAFYVMDKSLRRLCQAVSVAYGQSFLCDSDQRQHTSSVGSRVYSRYQYRFDQRSTRSLDWIELRQAISRSSSMRSIYRSRNQQDLGVSHQQLCIASDHNLCSVQTKMAGRTVLQVDQTAPSNQIFLRNDRKRSQDTGVDRHIHLRADRHHEKETEFAAFALRNSQSFGSQHV